MKRGCRLLYLCGVIVIVSLAVIKAGSRNVPDAARLQESIARSIIRFHVRANSDSDYDQELKLKVKDAVVTYLSPMLSESQSIEQSRDILENHIGEIKETALSVIRDSGSSYDVSVYFEKCYFPMKSYGNVTFPPGEYEAFRIDIGDNAGKNWWCVLYPPLCFVDAVYGEMPESSCKTLENVLTEDEYNAITNTEYELRFKYLTWLNRLFDTKMTQ